MALSHSGFLDDSSLLAVNAPKFHHPLLFAFSSVVPGLRERCLVNIEDEHQSTSDRVLHIIDADVAWSLRN